MVVVVVVCLALESIPGYNCSAVVVVVVYKGRIRPSLTIWFILLVEVLILLLSLSFVFGSVTEPLLPVAGLEGLAV